MTFQVRHDDRDPDTTVDRRRFLGAVVSSVVAVGLGCESTSGEKQPQPAAPPEPAAEPLSDPIVDTHMHVWSSEPERYPFPHPYSRAFEQPVHDATVEMLVEDMDRHGCTHAVLVQVIYHGWDNRYIADCLKRFPGRFKGHGLIDPTDPDVADKLELWIEERGLDGMRFSPIYYREGRLGGDRWLDAKETHELWERAEKLGAVFNFFIAPSQLARLGAMARAHPGVPVVVDHLGRVDMAADDADAQLENLLALASAPNVSVKVSELDQVSGADKPAYPFEETWPHVRLVHAAFGADRLLWGTGYPGAAREKFRRPTLEEEIDLIRTKIPGLSSEDRAKILGRNAARLWGFG